MRVRPLNAFQAGGASWAHPNHPISRRRLSRAPRHKQRAGESNYPPALRLNYYVSTVPHPTETVIHTSRGRGCSIPPTATMRTPNGLLPHHLVAISKPRYYATRGAGLKRGNYSVAHVIPAPLNERHVIFNSVTS